MKTAGLTDWIREEHHKVDELAHALRDRAGIVPRTGLAEWIVDVRDQFDHFRAHLMRHMALEEHEGYMSSVTARRPALSEVVERLRHEHHELSRLMEGIGTTLTTLEASDPLLVQDASRRIMDLIHVVERHEADENLMMLSAFTADIGTKD